MQRSHSLRVPRHVWTLGMLAGLIAILYLARTILVPLAFALMLTLILAPVVNRLVALRIKRAVAALTVVFISVAAIGAVGIVILNQLLSVLNELPAYQQNIQTKLAAAQTSNSTLGRASENLKKVIQEFSGPAPVERAPPRPVRRGVSDPNTPQAVRVVSEPPNNFRYMGDLAKPLVTRLGEVGIVLIVTIFLLIEQSDVRDRLFRLAGLSHLYLVTRALDDAANRVSRYLRLQFSVNLIFGALFGAGLSLIGLPYAALWGGVAALFRLVPYVGSATAGLMPLLLSLAVFDHWTQPILVLALFATLELTTANLIEPWLYGAHTGISSLMLLLCTVFWTTLWGPAGLILSTPLTVCLVVLGLYVPQFSWLHILLGDEPVLAAGAQLYQRLLAGDDAGARLVVTRTLESGSSGQLYETVVVPALSMIKRDRARGELDAEREESVLGGMRDIVGGLDPRLTEEKPADSSTPVPSDSGARVFCIPVSGECDEVAAAVLAQLMTSAGVAAVALPSESRLSQVTRILRPAPRDTFCIAALAPCSFQRARDLSANLQRRFPGTAVVVVALGFSGDPARALERFGPARPKSIVSTLAAAVEQLAPRREKESGTESERAEPSAQLSDVHA